MLIISYENTGYAYSDFDLLEQAQKIIDEYKNNKVELRVVSTDNVIMALRVLVTRNKISHSDICFKFEGNIITINEYGELSDFPSGFLNKNLPLYRELVEKRLGRKIGRQNETKTI